MQLSFILHYKFLNNVMGVCVLIAIGYQLSVVSQISRLIQNNSYSWQNQSSRTDNSHIPNPKAVICSIQVKEDAYIDEWVDYHLAIGFRKVYIYDNSKNFDLKEWGKHRLSDTVMVKHFPGIAKQNAAYFDCAKRAEKDGYTWAAFFDVDEFLCLKKHKNVINFLILPATSISYPNCPNCRKLIAPKR